MQFNKKYMHPIRNIVIAIVLFTNVLYAENQVTSGYIDFPDGKIFYQSAGSGEPMIVLHGGPGLAQGYLLPQMLDLADHNKVFFYDQRGSGRSSDFKLDSKTINISSFIGDLEMLREKLGLKKFILVGHSFGGLLAMNYAIAYPENLSSLILIGTLPADPVGMHKFLAEYDKTIEPLLPRIHTLENSETFKKYEPSAVIDFYRTILSMYCFPAQNVDKLSLHFTPNSAKNGFIVEKLFDYDSLEYDLTKDLQKLSVPTLIVHGEFDLIPLSTAEYIHKEIPNSKLVVIKNSDHFPYIAQPKEFFYAINEFLQSNHIN